MKLDFTEQEVQIILEVLSSVAYRISAPIIYKIQQQAQEAQGRASEDNE